MSSRSAADSASQVAGRARIEPAPSAMRSRFRAMGTEMFLIAPEGVPGFDRAIARVRAMFDRAEQRFSRFRSDSELSEVNRRAGEWTPVSKEFAELLGLALDGARRSGGLFDPTMLRALVAAGYDRDFSTLGSVTVHETHTDVAPVPRDVPGRWQEVRLQDERVFLPEGIGLDFGGIAKGWVADLGARSCDDWPWVVVDAGGDLRIGGSPPDGGLDIATEDPRAPGAEVVRLKLSSGALATSAITRRAWGPRLHHVIDPRTGRPAITRVLQATAWADTCAEAEVRATWALLAGPAVLEDLPAILFLESGEVRLNLDVRADGRPLEGGTNASPAVPASRIR